MDLSRRLQHLSRLDFIESIYLVGRFLSERLSRSVLERLLKQNTKIGDRARVETAVLGILDEIEKTEGAAVQNISEDVRIYYSDELDSVFRKGVQENWQRVSDAEVERALERLRADA